MMLAMQSRRSSSDNNKNLILMLDGTPDAKVGEMLAARQFHRFETPRDLLVWMTLRESL